MSETGLMREVGATLRLRRKTRGLSQTEVARRGGLSLRAYQNYERGQREIGIVALRKIAMSLSCGVDDLLGLPAARQSDHRTLAPHHDHSGHAPMSGDTFARDLGVRIKQLRKLANMSQGELAHCIGCARDTVSRYERGGMDMSAFTLGSLARVFGCSADDLLNLPRADRPDNRTLALAELIQFALDENGCGIVRLSPPRKQLTTPQRRNGGRDGRTRPENDS